MSRPKFPMDAILPHARRAHETLEQAGIPYYIWGGFALVAYGCRELTHDVDTVIPLDRWADCKSVFLPFFKQYRNEKQAFIYNDSKVKVDFRFWYSEAEVGGVLIPNPLKPENFKIWQGVRVLNEKHLLEIKLGCVAKAARDLMALNSHSQFQPKGFNRDCENLKKHSEDSLALARLALRRK